MVNSSLPWPPGSRRSSRPARRSILTRRTPSSSPQVGQIPYHLPHPGGGGHDFKFIKRGEVKREKKGEKKGEKRGKKGRKIEVWREAKKNFVVEVLGSF